MVAIAVGSAHVGSLHYFDLREEVKLAFRDLLKELPVGLAMDLLLDPWGLYSRLLVNPGQWGPRLGGDALAEIRETARVGQEEWASVLLELLSRGADIRSRPILHEALDVVLSTADVGMKSAPCPGV